LAAVVGLALLAAYVAVQRGQVKSYDGSIMVNLATRLLTKHTFTILPASDVLHLQSPYTSYGFGTTLLALPFDALQRAVLPGGQSLLTLANPVVLAACGSLIFLIGRRLGWRSWVCVLTALGFGLLTTALWQSTEMLSEPGVTLGALLIVFGALSWRDAPTVGAFLVGVGAATAILFRPDSLVLVVPLALVVPFIVPRDQIVSRGTVLASTTPLIVVATFQLWYDNHRYGSVLQTGLSQQARGRGFDTPIIGGLDLLLRSPGRGFFWTSPILVIALPGLVFLGRRSAALAVVIGGLVVARFLFFAHWWIPGGGVAWGPRLLFPVTALLAIPAGELLDTVCGWEAARRRIAFVGIGGVAAMSAFVSILSITVGYEQYWNAWTHVAPKLQAGRAHSYFWSLAHNAIAGDIHLLRTGQPIAPIHFRGGPDAVGVIAAAGALITIVLALVMAQRDARQAVPATGGKSAPSDRPELIAVSDAREDGVSPRASRASSVP
jgi:hypothetical protein